MALQQIFGTGFEAGWSYKTSFIKDWVINNDVDDYLKKLGFFDIENSSNFGLRINVDSDAATKNNDNVGAYLDFKTAKMWHSFENKDNFELAFRHRTNAVKHPFYVTIDYNAGSEETITFVDNGQQIFSTVDNHVYDNYNIWGGVYYDLHLKVSLVGGDLSIAAAGPGRTCTTPKTISAVTSLNKLGIISTAKTRFLDDITIWSDSSDAAAETAIINKDPMQQAPRYIWAPASHLTPSAASTTWETIASGSTVVGDVATVLTDGDFTTGAVMDNSDFGFTISDGAGNPVNIQDFLIANGYTIGTQEEVISLRAIGYHLADNEIDTFAANYEGDNGAVISKNMTGEIGTAGFLMSNVPKSEFTADFGKDSNLTFTLRAT